MDPNTGTEGEYVAALTERERDIYSRGHNTGLLARGRISFGPIPLFDPRTYRGPDAATDGEPTATPTPTATTTTSAVPTSTPAPSDGDKNSPRSRDPANRP